MRYTYLVECLCWKKRSVKPLSLDTQWTSPQPFHKKAPQAATDFMSLWFWNWIWGVCAEGGEEIAVAKKLITRVSNKSNGCHRQSSSRDYILMSGWVKRKHDSARNTGPSGGIRATTSSLPEQPTAHLLRHAALRFITVSIKSRRSLNFNPNNLIIKTYFNIFFFRILPRKWPLLLSSTKGGYTNSLLALVMFEAHNFLQFTTLTRRKVKQNFTNASEE